MVCLRYEEKVYRSGSQNRPGREMGYVALTWAMQYKRQNAMQGPTGLAQIEKRLQLRFQMVNSH